MQAKQHDFRRVTKTIISWRSFHVILFFREVSEVGQSLSCSVVVIEIV